jgi:Rrf2 family protein
MSAPDDVVVERVRRPLVQVSAKADYALRAACELAASVGQPRKAEEIAQAQDIPQKFLENILLELKRAEIIHAQRGVHGGYRLARPPQEITLADVFRAVQGPLMTVQSLRPDTVSYSGAATALQNVWIAVRANLRAVLEAVTLADVVAGTLPPDVQALMTEPDAWTRH